MEYQGQLAKGDHSFLTILDLGVTEISFDRIAFLGY